MTAKQLDKLIRRWLERCGLEWGSVQQVEVPKGAHRLLYPEIEITEETVKEWGVESHFAARAAANLHYLKDLEESRPKWPHPLDLGTVWQGRVKISRGLGL